MKKIAILAALLGLTTFVAGCSSPEQKKADAEKKMIDADANEQKTVADATAKESKIANEAQNSIDKQEAKKADAAQDAVNASR